ncbi:hypothetical protein CYMTET_37446 [Cymbomonas tetramitiformis]|uniref:Mannosyl-oligosaccharide glucosidase n=1 Tax=Cymbomonas tetramitiformis TaxID=36881 RepID=A0AAE0F6M7_9CHLO|nr:hypothetical protein CYMTET_37446 [Cymbomonas tetramitiformis]
MAKSQAKNVERRTIRERSRSEVAESSGGSSFDGFIGSAVVVVVAALLALATHMFWPKMLSSDVPRAITPLGLPKLTELPQFGGESEERMLWGTYRPGCYLGLRMRRPQSILVGLMWFDPLKAARAPPNDIGLRHWAQEGDKLAKYGWRYHDGSTFGQQEILDGEVRLVTDFVKSSAEGSGYGGDWALRIRASRKPTAEPLATGEGPGKISLVFYVAHEDIAGASDWRLGGRSSEEGAALLAGVDDLIGEWGLHTGGSASTGKLRAFGVKTAHMHNLTDLVKGNLRVRGTGRGKQKARYPELPEDVEDGANILMFQLTTALPLDAEFVLLSSPKHGQVLPESKAQRLEGLRGAKLEALVESKVAEFQERFGRTFELKPWQDASGDKMKAGMQEMAQAALSNTLGAMGYFYGQSLVNSKAEGGRVMEYWPTALYTAVPSRSFFPRGFLWDEGFHQLLVQQWDPQISRSALAHWLDLLNTDGWIPREQILGEEARARVPSEFVVQASTPDSPLAHPPPLFLLLPLLPHTPGGGLLLPMIFYLGFPPTHPLPLSLLTFPDM